MSLHPEYNDQHPGSDEGDPVRGLYIGIPIGLALWALLFLGWDAAFGDK